MHLLVQPIKYVSHFPKYKNLKLIFCVLWTWTAVSSGESVRGSTGNRGSLLRAIWSLSIKKTTTVELCLYIQHNVKNVDSVRLCWPPSQIVFGIFNAQDAQGKAVRGVWGGGGGWRSVSGVICPAFSPLKDGGNWNTRVRQSVLFVPVNRVAPSFLEEEKNKQSKAKNLPEEAWPMMKKNA